MLRLVSGVRFKKLVSLVIAIVLSVEPVLAQLGQLPQSTTPKQNSTNRPEQSMQAADQALEAMDPVYAQFKAAASKADLKFVYDPLDPAIDRNPYFMRSQSWGSNVHKKNNALNVVKTQSGIDIYLEDTFSVLHLNEKFTPVQATSRYIFLSVDKDNLLFERAAGLGQLAGEGLFFIDRDDLPMHAANNLPVPVFFLPLSGQGWKGQLHSIEIAQADMLVIANKTESVAIELRDIEELKKSAKLNLMMASLVSAKNRGDFAGIVAGAKYPAPGMTAAFGLFFTGIDLQMPEKSVWPLGSSEIQTSSIEKGFLNHIISSGLKDSRLGKMGFYLNSLFFPKAQAFAVSQQLNDRILFVGSALTGMLALSFLLKYAHPGVRKKLQSLREEDGVNPKTLYEKGKREAKEVVDVFAAMTSTVANLHWVGFANGLEVFLDRFAPSVAAADHTLIRRFLKNTFYFSRDSLDKIPVNARTFYLGAIIWGGVDTASVHMQYQMAVPWLAEHAAQFTPEEIKQKIEKVFDVNNPNYASTATEDTVRGAIVASLKGASDFSVNRRVQFYDQVSEEVDVELRSKGKNPLDPNVATERKSLISQKLNFLMKQAGLPDESRFLFDTSSMFSNIPKALGYTSSGYTLSEAFKSKLKADNPNESMEVLEGNVREQQAFILEKRYGLSKNAMKKAIRIAREWVQNDSSDSARQALSLLEETFDSMNYTKNWLADDFEGLQKARQVRQQITILSYEGPVHHTVHFLPDTWGKNYSGEAIQAAAIMFRQALFSHLDRDGDDLIFNNPEKVQRYGKLAQKKALQEMINEKPNLTEELINSSAELKFQLKMRTSIAIYDLAKADELQSRAEAYEPPKLDWLAQRKHNRALKIADEKMAAYLDSENGKQSNEDNLFQIKQKFYTEALAKQVGVHIEDKALAEAQERREYIELLGVVEANAVTVTQNDITKNKDQATYLSKLPKAEQEKMKMFLYANNYLKAYINATTNSEFFPVTEPAQPGRLQYLRQTQVVRKSAFLTRVIRGFEAFGEDQSVELGVKGAIFRNFPLAKDMFVAHKNMLKTLLPSLTIGFLWNFFMWQVHIPYATFIIFALTVPATIAVPSMLLGRFFRQQGWKPKGGVLPMIGFALPYAWLTFLYMFPMMLFAGDVSALLSSNVIDPVISVFSKIEAKDWLLGFASLGLLVKTAKSKEPPDFIGKSKHIQSVFNNRCVGLFSK